MNQSHKQIVVYCDESRHDNGPGNHYMGIGGVWVPRLARDKYRDQLDQVALQHKLGGEIKWNKVSGVSLAGYKAFVDEFFAARSVWFRSIIVEHERLDYETYHGGDIELGFYKFYYQMLVKWLEPEAEYVILLDHKVNAAPSRYSKLQEVLDSSTDASTLIKLSVADSKESRIAQLADLLVGAVSAAWCGTEDGTAKDALQRYIASRLGRTTLRFASPSPEIEKFNVFKIQLPQSVE